MVDSWVLWVLIVGLAAGGVLTWLVMVRLPRREDDVSLAERPAEAAWIGQVIERNGGIAPAALVEEVLDLHQAYLADAHVARSPTTGQRREALSLPPTLPGWPVMTVAGSPPAGQPPGVNGLPPAGPTRPAAPPSATRPPGVGVSSPGNTPFTPPGAPVLPPGSAAFTPPLAAPPPPPTAGPR